MQIVSSSQDKIREVAHTVKAVAGAVAMIFTAVAMATVVVGAIRILTRIW